MGTQCTQILPMSAAMSRHRDIEHGSRYLRLQPSDPPVRGLWYIPFIMRTVWGPSWPEGWEEVPLALFFCTGWTVGYLPRGVRFSGHESVSLPDPTHSVVFVPSNDMLRVLNWFLVLLLCPGTCKEVHPPKSPPRLTRLPTSLTWMLSF